MRPTVLIADDHPVYRDGLRLMLESTGEVEVLGTAADGLDAVIMARELRPDVAVLDISMPTVDGVEAARRILAAEPGTGILMLTMYDDDANVFAAMLAGARGYLVKGADQTQILRAITAVAAGETIFGPALAARVTAYFGRLAASPAADPFPELTAREREVLELLAAGLGNAQIGARLGISPKTVRNNVSAVLAKLRVADRAQAVLRARSAGLG
ncbi:DNA-binding response regulator [Actinorhabdospora filicis]|uniref:DNA-binding response regulator n=1 Tax=Actinorhabdospora filicis TaxID=1785913 RepID=A0A9W6W8K4_9ACTN|nr:response regulator transcription factor [Actinorhabdospora filicis]GLZ77659.1 DNA-binding response regulator [Actinorhabdospora filicis]